MATLCGPICPHPAPLENTYLPPEPDVDNRIVVEQQQLGLGFRPELRLESQGGGRWTPGALPAPGVGITLVFGFRVRVSSHE